MPFWLLAGVAAISVAVVAAEAPVKLTWPAGGSPVRFVATITGAESARLIRPAGIAVDDNQRVFVADPIAGAVLVFDRKTGSAARWTGSTQFPLKGPVGVALDKKGRLFVCDGFQPQIVVFDLSGNPMAAFGKDVLQRPSGIVIGPKDGRIWVTDTRLQQVLSFDPEEFTAGPAIGGADAIRFSSPSILAMNSKGELYVSDRLHCRMQIFDSGGVLLRRLGLQCGGNADSGRPNPVAVDRMGCVYVASTEDNSLQIFSPEGKPLQLASLGPSNARPCIRVGMTVRGNRIYVVEQEEGAGRVQIYSFTPPARSRLAAQAPERGAGRR